MGWPFQNVIFSVMRLHFHCIATATTTHTTNLFQIFYVFLESTLLRLSDVSFRIEKAAIVPKIWANLVTITPACGYQHASICKTTG
jgi:hypothetical protein